ncbi:MAG: DUF1156 domain-containing protein [Nanoarchaeota archaeon]|nr:DUF1156 domain-containing protein [Nanoarchaeota archaeon]MCG2718603.1 DUF1156 domain-containing protein [Nanoarchaeota archaeon]
MTDKRFIEESFPVKEVSIESAKEKNIRRGHISTLHIWWARKPLSCSRATNYAALIPFTKNKGDWEKKRKFIIELSKWENSLNKNLIEKARKDILEANGGKPPKVLDPFSGGGAIPLEALRLGCETYASDYNPVAVLIERCTLEYPQKYGNKLIEDVKKWGEWVLEEAKKELAQFYPADKEQKKSYFGDSSQESNPVGYYWMRTITCQNPNCEAEIPLTTNWWLVKKSNKHLCLYPYVENKKVKFKIVGDGYEKMPDNFDPENGTVSRANVECPVCNSVVEAADTRKQFQEKKSAQRMIAVVLHKTGTRGKRYRIAIDQDMIIYNKVEKYLEGKKSKLEKEWGISAVPDEELPLMSGTFNVPIYGMNKWGDLFNFRQQLCLICFTEKIKQVYSKLLREKAKEDYAKSVVSYLAIGLDKIADYNNVLCQWRNNLETVGHTFARQALPMMYNYIEGNPITGASGTWSGAMKWILDVIQNGVGLPYAKYINQSSAMKMPWAENFFDAVFTDPPYYNAVPYADLSDFFYVWLKRSIGDLYPELFSTPLTPKSEELAEMSSWDKRRYAHKTKEYFEKNLKETFLEIHRCLKPDGIAVIVYAHKTTAGWETVINALFDSGLSVTASWPISTEMVVRLRAQECAVLASSIYIIARKIKKKELGLYPKVKKELHIYLNEKLERLWQEGISGADFFIAAIGAGIEIFGKYEKIIDDEGKVVRADKLLEEIRTISTNFAVKQILHNGFAGEISPLTRFYVLWRWNYQEAKVPFDEARKLSQSFSVNLEKEWNKGFIIKEKEFIKVIGPKERQLKDLEDSKELIDVLHYVLLLWEKGEKDKLLKKLSEGYGNSEAFYRVAQAISSTLSNESKERKLLDGFLAGKEKIRAEVKSSNIQDKLERWVK